METADLPRRWAWLGLALVLAGGLALRLWGLRSGLPYAYNADEGDHFVPRAVAMFGHGLNPHYFANPPAFTYLLHILFALAWGSARGVRHTYAHDPTAVYTLARVAAAVLGTASLWLLYATGARLFSRAVGLLAAAIEAVAFLPVFYAHLALNDVPTLAPLTLSLLGSAGVLRKGRLRDYLLAGVGLGLACASKYTAGIALLPLLAAAAARSREYEPALRRRVLGALALAGACAVAAFVIANPFSVLDYTAFHRELVHQSKLSAEAQGKLGAPRGGGVVYYLWALTWGLGWLPAVAALGGAIGIWRLAPAAAAGGPHNGPHKRERDGARLGWMLVPAPAIFLLLMGVQGRYFGRWLLPILPILCLLGAFSTLRAGASLAALLERGRPDARGRSRLLGATAVALVAGAVLAQGLFHSVHTGIVLSRTDTRTLTRAWMLTHVPLGSRIVVEPVAPDDWARQAESSSGGARAYHWRKYPSLISRISPTGALSATLAPVGIENYERTLSPALIGYYERHGYCWVISGSTQAQRAFADPRAVPGAVAYYRALAAAAQIVFRASPYARDARPVAFNFDWSFDYYPLAYARPGPLMTVYRLRAGRCSHGAGLS